MELIRDADAAMYESKRRGRNSFSRHPRHSPPTPPPACCNWKPVCARLLSMVNSCLHHQPMIQCPSDRRIVAVEALVRSKTAADGSDALVGHRLNDPFPSWKTPA